MIGAFGESNEQLLAASTPASQTLAIVAITSYALMLVVCILTRQFGVGFAKFDLFGTAISPRLAACSLILVHLTFGGSLLCSYNHRWISTAYYQCIAASVLAAIWVSLSVFLK